MKKIFSAVIALMMTVSVPAQFYIYLSNGEVLQADSISTLAPSPQLPGEFSVSATTKVHFSQGNLQATYNGSTWTWSFATNQWDYIGKAAANNAINGNGTASSNGTVDLFGWSTASTYYGINNSTSNETYSGDFVDWGNNPITNGGNKANMWRTLTKDEWVYLFYGRTDAAKLFGMGTVNGVKGTILLPDNWTGNKFSDTENGLADQGSYYSNSKGTNYSFHSYTEEQWKTVMEPAGAVFLPAGGFRNGTNVNYVDSYGFCWSATPYETNTAYYLSFYSEDLKPQNNNNRYRGQSVRLVR